MIVLDGALMNENEAISPALRIVLAVFNNLFVQSDDEDREAWEVRIADERRIVGLFADDVERDMMGQKGEGGYIKYWMNCCKGINLTMILRISKDVYSLYEGSNGFNCLR